MSAVSQGVVNAAESGSESTGPRDIGHHGAVINNNVLDLGNILNDIPAKVEHACDPCYLGQVSCIRM